MSNKLHVFIDTNVWLSFYSYNKDDLEQLRIINTLIKNKEIVLYTNSHLVSELERNREGKLAESTKNFSRIDVQRGVPRYMQGYPEVEVYEQSLKELEKARDLLIKRVREDAQNKQLGADLLIDSIWAEISPPKVSNIVLRRAKRRQLLGNPPGVPTSIGDQIHWEYLLDTVPDETDIHIVSNDSDWKSKLIDGRAHQSLIEEWKERKHGVLTLHSEIRPFLGVSFPKIKFAVDFAKSRAVANLISSMSFTSTHRAVSSLMSLADEVTWQEADQIFTAAVDNSQIRRIGSDPDVRALLILLMKRFKDKISDERWSTLQGVLYPKTHSEFEEEEEENEAPL